MIMAVESEFGIAGGHSQGRAEAIQGEVVKTMPWIPSQGQGAYLANGGRVYVDAGNQNEYCTPEASDPAELVIHELAGRRLMAGAAAGAGQTLMCSNVDPVYGTTWGSHENYSSGNPIDTPSRLMPLLVHLATRIPYTGAGGLSPRPGGAGVVMSPRVLFLRARLGRQGIDRRTMVFNKLTDTGPLSRNHIICGESLLSHYASYLRYATTALVVACIDAGLPLADMQFRHPMQRIINLINRDLGMQRVHELSDGRRYTVLDVQAALLESVEVHLPRLPAWAPRAIRRWHQVLDHLRGGHGILATRLDWMLYRHLLRQLCDELGMGADALLAGGRLDSAGDSAAQRKLKAHADELYLRLHLLGRESLFEQLDAEKRLDHRLAEVSTRAVERAMACPPEGRAAERALLIRTYWKERDLKMTWSTLEDGRPEPVQNPIVCQGGAIKVMRSEDRETHRGMLGQALGHFEGGDYGNAVKCLCLISTTSDSEVKRQRIQTLCLSHARLGNQDEALQALEVHQALHTAYVHQVYRLFCGVNFGLIPPATAVRQLLRDCDTALGDQRDSLDDFDYHRLILEQCRASYLNSIGQPAKAEALCRKLLARPEHRSRVRMSARTCSFLAAAFLAQGKKRAAALTIGQVLDTQVREGLFGDLATYTYPLLARLQDVDERACEILRRAESTQRKLANPLGLARILFIKARRLGTDENLEEARALRRQCQAIQGCPLAGRIIGNWEEWVAGPKAEEADDYWGM